MKNALKNVLFFLSLFLFLSGLALAEPVAPTPDQLIRNTSAAIVAKVRANRKALEKDVSRIYALAESDMLPHSDFVVMSRRVLGKHWNNASPEQQQEFIQQFQQLLIRTYATALLKYAETKVEYLPYRPKEASSYAVVKTRVWQKGVTRPIPIDYLLHLNPNESWKVVDIKIDNLSLVGNYQSSFSSQIRNHGVDGLLKDMKARNLELGGSAGPTSNP